MARIDGLRDERGHFMQSYQLYRLLKDRGFMEATSRVCRTGGSCGIHGVHVTILPAEHHPLNAQGRRPHNAKHRVLAECDCGRKIPFGRLGQHRRACRANVFAD